MLLYAIVRGKKAMNTTTVYLITAVITAAVALGTVIAPSTAYSAPSSVLDFTMKSIDGADVPLKSYAGKVILIVNVASKCGLTPQYDDLQAIYEKYEGKGLVILGFPANNFADQEPGTNEEIQQFCRLTYGVSFPMFSKISVKGDTIDPLYRYLTDPGTNPKFPGEIAWNFTKFLVGRDGAVIDRFAPKVKPSDPSVIEAIETALGAE